MTTFARTAMEGTTSLLPDPDVMNTAEVTFMNGVDGAENEHVKRKVCALLISISYQCYLLFYWHAWCLN